MTVSLPDLVNVADTLAEDDVITILFTSIVVPIGPWIVKLPLASVVCEAVINSGKSKKWLKTDVKLQD